MKLTRREFIELGAGTVVAGSIARGLYETHELDITRHDIRLKRLPEAMHNLRVAQLSDIHFYPNHPAGHVARAVAAVNRERPDLVLLTGDFVTSAYHQREQRAQHAWPCAEILRGLRATMGIFAVLGNHDHHSDADVVSAALRSSGNIRLLRNESVPLTRGGSRIWMAGLDSASAHAANVHATLKGIPVTDCVLAAVHEPDFADVLRQFPVDMQFSGHSHGGQIVFPVVGALYYPWGAHKYPRGYYRLGEYQLYTNRGLGEIVLPMRLMCPPELSIFTLKSGTLA
ncbi:MAG: metallophosphoesterase [Acidobacteriota bacterium]|nr:metallophosphoesterase [Acidobacteriota bacterium]